MTRKNLGQNFLTNKNKIGKIIRALELKNGDTVVEIGPGHGELTKEIITRSREQETRIIAIEKDGALAEKLRGEVGRYGDFVEIITGDVLKILPSLIRNSGYKVVGNIPYYITGFILRTLGELKNKPKIIVLTVQKEVAERITAKPPKMNLLAATVQFWAEAETLDIIPKSDFSPKPKVDSAIIKLIPRETGADPVRYYSLVRTIFKQPRKTVLNNLSPLAKNRKFIEEKLKKNGIGAGCRPQNLNILQIKRLAEEFSG